MSFKRTPFQFSDFNADDRRSELLRRFGFQPEQGSNMFYEPSAPSWSDWPGRLHRPGFYDPDWRNTGSFFSGSGGSAPGSPQPRMRNRGWSSPTVDVNDAVPIKVVHEQSDDGDNHSDTSSQGSRSSNGSSGSKLRHEPRVHHIPIMVEPRDGSSSSGYGSDGENKRKTAGGVPSPASSSPSQKVSSPLEKKIHTIPIQVQCGDSTTAEPLAKSSVKQEGCNGEPMAMPDRGWANTFPRQKCQQTPAKTAPNTTTKSASGGTIPTTGQRGGETTSRQQGPRPKSPGIKGHPPPNSTGESSKGSVAPDEVIRRINLELKDLKEQVYNFRGEPGDKQYRFLDEMLTRLMLRLDTIDPAGNDEIRRMRKLAINDVQRVINRLEGKEQPCTDLVAIGERELVEADEEGEIEAVEEHDVPAVLSPPPGTEERSGYASFKGSSSNYLSSCNLCNVLGGDSETGKAGPEPAKIVEHGGGLGGVADGTTLVLDEVSSVPEPADLSSSGEMMSGPVDATLTASGGDREVYSQLDPDASSMIDQGVARGNSSEEGIRTPYNENALSVPSYIGEASLEASRDRSDPSVSESGFTDL